LALPAEIIQAGYRGHIKLASRQVTLPAANYSHPVVCQIFEKRYLPAAAVVLFAISPVVLQYARKTPVLWSKVFFSAGVGAIGFSFFRLVVFHAS
jgi:hypothetical protein